MIINYFHYVDDMLIFYSNHTNIQAILTDFNSIHPNLHFTAESEQNNTINHLHNSIQRTAHNITQTFTDTIVHYSSNHPTQHKYAAVTFLYNRLHTYQLHKEEYNRGKNIIHNILYNLPSRSNHGKFQNPNKTRPRDSQI